MIPDPRDTLEALAERDPVVAAAVVHVGSLPDRRRACTLASLIRIVTGQQLSVNAAAAIYERLEHLIGGPPTAERLAAHDDDALRAIGLSRAKVASVRDLGAADLRGDLDLASLPSMTDDEVYEHLIVRKGVGPWTVDLVRLFLLGRPDVWPVGDLGVRAGLQHLLGLDARPDVARARELGARWAPFRSGAALLCWRLLYVDDPFLGAAQ
ncbi:MAG: DNA-3-methyladenine glycosylase 2 family protein [Myxococcota bacterium]